MAQKKNVRFIRKNGRVIPIKVDPNKNRRRGTAIGAIGVPAVTAGVLYKTQPQYKATSKQISSFKFGRKINPVFKWRKVSTKNKIRSVANSLKKPKIGLLGSVVGAAYGNIIGGAFDDR